MDRLAEVEEDEWSTMKSILDGIVARKKAMEEFKQELAACIAGDQ